MDFIGTEGAASLAASAEEVGVPKPVEEAESPRLEEQGDPTAGSSLSFQPEMSKFEDAVDKFQQVAGVLTPKGEGGPGREFAALGGASPLKFPTSPSAFTGASGLTSPNVTVRGNIELVTQQVLQDHIGELDRVVTEHINQEITNLGLKLGAEIQQLASRFEAALVRQGGELGQDIARQRHELEDLGARLDGQDQQLEKEMQQLVRAQESSLELGQRLSEEAEKLGRQVQEAQLTGQQLTSRLDREAAQLRESMATLELQQQQMATERKSTDRKVEQISAQLDELLTLNATLATRVDADLSKFQGIVLEARQHDEQFAQKFDAEIEDFKRKLQELAQVQISDQHDFHEVEQFQKELSQRLCNDVEQLKGQVAAVEDRVQEDLSGLNTKLCADLQNLEMDRQTVGNRLEEVISGLGALVEATDDDKGSDSDEDETAAEDVSGDKKPRVDPENEGSMAVEPWAHAPVQRSKQRGSLFANTLAPTAPTAKPTGLASGLASGLAGLQSKMDQKIDLSLSHLDAAVMSNRASIQQLGQSMTQMRATMYSDFQQQMNDNMKSMQSQLKEEVVSVSSDMQLLRSVLRNV